MGWIDGSKPINAPLVNVPIPEKAAPTQIRKSPYGTVSNTAWKEMATAFKITCLSFVKRLYSIVGNDSKVTHLNLLIKHLSLDLTEHLTDNKVALVADRILVKSRNMMQRDQLETEAKRSEISNDQTLHQLTSIAEETGQTKTAFKDLILSKSKDAEKLKTIAKETKGGVCLGACVDFASKVLKLPNVNQASLMSVAKDYQSGIPAAGVVNQFAYSRFLSSSKAHRNLAAIVASISRNELTKEEANFLKQASAGIEKAGKDNREAGKKINDCTSTLQRVSDSLQALNPNSEDYEKEKIKLVNEFKEAKNELFRLKEAVENPSKWLMLVRSKDKLALLKDMGKFPELKGSLSKNIEAWMKNYLNEEVEETPPAPIFAKTSPTAPTSLMSKIASINPFKPKTIPDQKVSPKSKNIAVLTPYFDTDLHWQQEKLSSVVRQRGLKMDAPMISGADRLKSNETILQKITTPDFETGVYNITFRTGTDGLHAMLLVKSGEKLHLWDPNYGLFDCGSTPDTFLANYLNVLYEKPNVFIPGQDPGTNHYIELSAYKKL